MSSRLPIGVGQTISSPGISPLLSSSIRAIAAAPIMPASSPSSAATTGVRFIGAQRPRSQLAARGVEQQVAGGHHAAADTITSGSKMLAKLARATPRRPPTRSKTSIAVASPSWAATGDRLAVDLLAGGEQLAEGGVGLAFGGRAAFAAERGARGERLDAAAVGAVALAARAVHRRSPCGRARRRRRWRRGRSRRRGSGRRRCRCRSSASPRCGRRGRRRRGARRGRRRWRRCRRRSAGRCARRRGRGSAGPRSAG